MFKYVWRVFSENNKWICIFDILSLSPSPLDKCGLSLQIPRSDISRMHERIYDYFMYLQIALSLSLFLFLSIYTPYFFYNCLHYFFITPWLRYTNTHMRKKRKKFIPLHLSLAFTLLLPRNEIALLKLVPLPIPLKRNKERKKISKEEKREKRKDLYQIYNRPFLSTFFHARWIRRDSRRGPTASFRPVAGSGA